MERTASNLGLGSLPFVGSHQVSGSFLGQSFNNVLFGPLFTRTCLNLLGFSDQRANPGTAVSGSNHCPDPFSTSIILKLLCRNVTILYRHTWLSNNNCWAI